MVRSARIDSRFKTTSYLVLGPAGSGKSTLVQHLIDKVCFMRNLSLANATVWLSS